MVLGARLTDVGAAADAGRRGHAELRGVRAQPRDQVEDHARQQPAGLVVGQQAVRRVQGAVRGGRLVRVDAAVDEEGRPFGRISGVELRDRQQVQVAALGRAADGACPAERGVGVGQLPHNGADLLVRIEVVELDHATRVLLQPVAQRHVLWLGRGVAVPARRTGAQQLPPDRIAALHDVGDGHVVARAQPAVAVAVEQRLARDVGMVRAAGVPDAAVEQHDAAARHQDLGRPRRIDVAPLAVDRRLVQVAARQGGEVAAASLAAVGEEEGHLQRHARLRRGLQLVVEAVTVLMPAALAGVRALTGAGGDDHVRVIDLDVPAQDVQHLGEGHRPVDHLQEPVVAPQKVEDVEPVQLACSERGPLGGDHGVECLLQAVGHRLRQPIREYQEAVARERLLLGVGQSVPVPCVHDRVHLTVREFVRPRATRGYLCLLPRFPATFPWVSAARPTRAPQARGVLLQAC